MDENMKVKTDSGSNTKNTFRIITKLFEEKSEFSIIRIDYTKCVISLKLNDNIINIAVKSGSPALAFKNLDGSWRILEGIDFVLYAPILISDEPVFDQLHVFDAKEFYQMWENLRLTRKKVSRGECARLEAIHGKGFRTDINLHADSITVQSFANSNKKLTALQNEIANYPTVSQDGLRKITEKTSN